MAVVKRGAVSAPNLPKETVEVEAIGGDVVVRGLTLTEYLAIALRMEDLARQARARRSAAESDGAAPAPAVGVADIGPIMPVLLAIAVVDADGLPLWSEAEWQAFGGKHAAQAMALFNVAFRLAGLDKGANAKN